MRDRVLFVDDEPLVLESLCRVLRGRYNVCTATSVLEGLTLIEEGMAQGNPFAVVVSDMMMPNMNGVDFLSRVSALVPDTITIVLSGQADLEHAISVVNNANLFRFLTKPCPSDVLRRTLDNALRQYELIYAERELLERTLGGAVTVLTEVLSMASPAASRRTAQMRALMASVAEQLDLQDDWRLPIAAMLSHIGCIAVPGQVLEKLEAGWELDATERAMFDQHPAHGRRLLAQIPRFEEIAEWIGNLPTSLHAPPAGRIPVHVSASMKDPAALVVDVAGNFLIRYSTGRETGAILRELESTRRYPDTLIEAVRGSVGALEPRGIRREVMARDLAIGMIFQTDVVTLGGQVLIRRGERVTAPMATRLANFASTVGVIEPIKVVVP